MASFIARNGKYFQLGDDWEVFRSPATAADITDGTTPKDTRLQLNRRLHSAVVSGVNGCVAGSKPLVIVCGWTRSNARALGKYSAMWKEQYGLDCLIARPPPVGAFDPDGPLLGEVAEEVLKQVDEHKFGTNIIFHIFSNGGSSLWIRIEKLMKEKGNKYATIGTIMDSAPCYLTHESAVNVTLRNMPKAVKLFAVAMCHVFGFVYGLYQMVMPGPKEPSRAETFWQKFTDNKQRCPELYLYSETDEFLHSGWSKKLVAHRSATSGNKVRSMCWAKSEHVKHYITHTHDYEHCVNGFCQDVIDTFEA
eukprot:GFYU01003642.1.p1 GENE.GFYU01003642.1~~GFYU01003642.1.p1  ORF type:complete len:307 (+),score=55.73 GFYU01003642.1:176-1096(+)